MRSPPGRIDVTYKVSSCGPPKAHIAGFLTGTASDLPSRPSGVKRGSGPAALPQIGLAVVRAYVPSVTPAEVAGMLSTLRS